MALYVSKEDAYSVALIHLSRLTGGQSNMLSVSDLDAYYEEFNKELEICNYDILTIDDNVEEHETIYTYAKDNYGKSYCILNNDVDLNYQYYWYFDDNVEFMLASYNALQSINFIRTASGYILNRENSIVDSIDVEVKSLKKTISE